jgi:hypothetical protein
LVPEILSQRVHGTFGLTRIIWIAKTFLNDVIKNGKFFLILFMVGVGVLLYAKLLEHLDLMVLFGPTVVIAYILGGIYYWYSGSYKMEQEKIINKLRGKR